ncbi:MAG: (Fe-S)-binding protein [Magnetococcales bacterium]|nr:(Fe-S)-binding protein [Magnetococcales bacterium]
MLKKFGKLDNALSCTHCGFCLPVCPTYRAENKEIQSPRGRVSAILALRNGTLTAEEVRRSLSYCLVCRACHNACPAGVRVGKLVVMARSYTAVVKPWPVRVFHGITDRDFLSRWASRLVGWYQRSRLRRIVRGGGLGVSHPVVQRLDTLIPDVTSPLTMVSVSPSGEGKPLRAALLCGCMARMFYPNVADSVISLLSRLNVSLDILQGFGCCGAPHREAGDREAFLRQAKKVLDGFSPVAGVVDVVVCDTAVCRITALSYARALVNDPHYGPLATQLSEKIVDFSELVFTRWSDRDSFFVQDTTQRIAFIDHCQTRHGYGITDHSRRLLAAISGRCIELPRSDQCCGAGGDLMLSHRDHSERIRADKLRAIAESGVQVVVGTNAGCLLNVAAGLKALHSAVQVVHLGEFLWKSSVDYKNSRGGDDSSKLS